MVLSNETATHPGVILLKEFLGLFGLTQKALAKHVGVSVQRVNEIVRGKRGVTSRPALEQKKMIAICFSIKYSLLRISV